MGSPRRYGRHLRGLRDGAGLSRAELARRASVPACTLRGWEADGGFPSLPALLRLVGALGVPVERLAEGAEDPAGEEGESVPRPGPGTARPAAPDPLAGTLAAEQQAVPPAGRDADRPPPAQHKPRQRPARRPRG